MKTAWMIAGLGLAHITLAAPIYPEPEDPGTGKVAFGEAKEVMFTESNPANEEALKAAEAEDSGTVQSESPLLAGMSTDSRAFGSVSTAPKESGFMSEVPYSSEEVTQVPESGSAWLLFALGCGALAILRRAVAK